MSDDLYRVFVSCGDLAGIGWQSLKHLILKAEKYFTRERCARLSCLTILGDIIASETLEIQKYFTVIYLSKNLSTREILLTLPSSPQKPVFLCLGSTPIKLGEPSLLSGARSYLYLQTAIQLFKESTNASLLTLPVSKEWIIKSGVSFQGHTEELHKAFQRKTWMCMYHPEMSVILLTNHIPVKKISSQIKKIDFDDLTIALLFFQKFFQSTKPVGFLGLNPHAGEGGKIGTEEKILKKKLELMKMKGISIDGIFSADGFFTSHIRKKYSLAIACYHDQGLIPFKALYGTQGINITLNLPKLRVSPDHGPAYSLAKQGNADINSILESLNFCLKRGESWIKHFSYP